MLGASLSQDRPLVDGILSAREPLELQLAAVKTLSTIFPATPEAAGELLLAAWSRLGPTVRGEVIEALLSRPEATAVLLKALESGELEADRIPSGARERLLKSGDETIRKKAARLLRDEVPAERAEVLQRYRDELKRLQGDVERGRGVFAKHCATCHRLEGAGFDVGPDLSESRGKDESLLLEAILNPGRMVPPEYTPYVVQLRSGKVASGLIAGETATSIELVRAEGIRETLLRKDVLRLASEAGSLMPAELEKVMDSQAMADLFAFLRSGPKDLDRLTEEEMAAARRELLAGGYNGLARVVSATEEARQKSWIGELQMFLARQLDGTHEVTWETDPVPEDLDPEGVHVFRLPVAMGYRSMRSGTFTLYLAERKLLDFDVSLQSETWKSSDKDVTLSYQVRARNHEDSTGMLFLELPAGYLQPGKAHRLRVSGSNTGSRRWFSVLPAK